MSAALFLALAGVYALSIAGIVVVGTLVETDDREPESLEQRLAVARVVVADDDTTKELPPYFASASVRRN